MKNNFAKFSLTALTILSILFIYSCNKTTSDVSSQEAESTLAEKTYADVYQISQEADNGSLNSYKTEEASDVMSSCATITRDTISSPHTITVNFGTTNCLCEDGKNRRGAVVISYVGHYKDTGSVHNISFVDYYVNDNKVEGTKTVTNMGVNAAGYTYFNIHVDGRIIKADGSGTVIWTSDRVREWISGESTASRRDDIYRVTGSATGTTASGEPFTANITTPLTIDNSCRYRITAGVIENTRSSRGVRTIDYGSGTCDDEATVTVGSRTRTIHF